MTANLEIANFESILYTIAAPLIAAASKYKTISSQLAEASIQERPLIKKYFYSYSETELKSMLYHFYHQFVFNSQNFLKKVFRQVKVQPLFESGL